MLTMAYDPEFKSRFAVGDIVYLRGAAERGIISMAGVSEVVVEEGRGPAHARVARYRLATSGAVDRGCRWLERDLVDEDEARQIAAAALRQRAARRRREAGEISDGGGDG